MIKFHILIKLAVGFYGADAIISLFECWNTKSQSNMSVMLAFGDTMIAFKYENGYTAQKRMRATKRETKKKRK